VIPVVATTRHRGHAPQLEVELGVPHAPFEHPGRAEVIASALAEWPTVEPREFGADAIERVHDPDLVRFLADAWSRFQHDVRPQHDVVPDAFFHAGLRRGMGEPSLRPTDVVAQLGYWCTETVTPLTEGTYDAARSAVDVALTATDIAMRGDAAAVYGLCRPPGHHATRDAYGGYCFFNNAAVAAQHAIDAGTARVTVLDVDYHHGNGTQQIFYDRGDVQYVSLHGDPRRAYPFYVGFADEIGVGRGSGANVNVPLAAATDDEAFVIELARACEQIGAFAPEVLIVSLGLDTFGGDPIADFRLTADGFEACGGVVAGLGLPTVVLQEGGYASDALGVNVRRWLTGVSR
jgi:acetoin utilization deacetylase AcuC-like enzyme